MADANTERFIFVAGLGYKDLLDFRQWGERLYVEDDGLRYGPRYVAERGCESRLVAAQVLFQQFSQRQLPVRLLVSGGAMKNAREETLSKAEISTEELVLKYFIPDNAVCALQSPLSTVKNIEAFLSYIQGRWYEFKTPPLVYLLTEGYHLPRFTLLTMLGAIKHFNPERHEAARAAAQEAWSDARAEWFPNGRRTGESSVRAALALRDALNGFVCRIPFCVIPEASEQVIRKYLISRSKKGRSHGVRYARSLEKDAYLTESMLPGELNGITDLLFGNYDESAEGAMRRQAGRFKRLAEYEGKK